MSRPDVLGMWHSGADAVPSDRPSGVGGRHGGKRISWEQVGYCGGGQLDRRSEKGQQGGSERTRAVTGLGECTGFLPSPAPACSSRCPR